MCVVSMIGDHYADKYKETMWINKIVREPFDPNLPFYQPPLVSKKEFEELKQDVQEMKKLLERAIKYDQDHNQPHCEKEEKIEFLRKLCKIVGVDLNYVLNKTV